MHKSIVYTIGLYLALLWSNVAEAKQYPMLHYTVEQGLPSNTIYDVYQDKGGMIWIGTDKGVARFNGIGFQTFTTADGLSDNECFFFKEDLQGRMWVGTFNGELCYYQNGRFHNPGNTTFLRHHFKTASTTNIVINADSSIFIFSGDYVGFVEIRGENVRYRVSPQIKKIYPSTTLVYMDKSAEGLYQFIYTYQKRVMDSSLALLSVRRINTDKLRRYLFATSEHLGYYVDDHNNLYSKDLEPMVFKAAPFTRNTTINHFAKDSYFERVACTGGVFFDSTLLLAGKTVNTTAKIRKSDYWIGTNKDGIYVLSSGFKKTSYLTNAYQEELVFAQHCNRFLLFAAKDKSLYRLNVGEGNHTVEQIARPADYTRSVADKILSGWIDSGSFFSFCTNWVYRQDGLTAKYPGKTKMLRNNPGQFMLINSIYTSNDLVCFKNRRQINGGARSNLLKVKDSLSVDTFRIQELNKALYGAAFDRNGIFWVSARENMYFLKNNALVKSTGFPVIGFREFVFCKNYFIGCSHTNELLITNNYAAARVKFDTIKSNDCVWDKFYPLNDSSWLIGTNNYFRILTLDHTSARPEYHIRLLEDPFVPYLPDFTYTDGNTCFFFKNGSITGLPVAHVLQEPEAPQIQFEELRTTAGSYVVSQEVKLEYIESKNISLLFNPVSNGYKNLSYEYSISKIGKREHWTEIKGNEINLYGTGFGHFNVSVRAKTMSGVYGKTASFKLTIAKAYWATYWFIGACIPLVIFIVSFLARIGIKQTLRRKERELRFLSSEYKALNALMNPHFIFNSLNSLQSLVNNNENKTASKYIRVFSDLIRQNMQNISQDLISLAKELDLVENYLRIEKLRFKEHLNYSISIDESVEADLIMIPPLLIQPLVENAIKHGIWPRRTGDGFISVIVYEKGEVLFIEIIDNGVGFQPASDTMHDSYAMTNIEKRTQQLSVIHNINIKVSVEELKNNNGNVVGVKSLITIDELGLPKDK